MLVKKIITNLDLSKASGPGCILVVVLKKCEPEFSYILAKLFNMCFKESCFRNCWKVSSVVPLFKDAGGRSMAKSYRPISFLSVLSKFFKKFEIIGLLITSRNVVFYLISSTASSIFEQLQIF